MVYTSIWHRLFSIGVDCSLLSCVDWRLLRQPIPVSQCSAMPHILLVTTVRVHVFLWGQTAYTHHTLFLASLCEHTVGCDSGVSSWLCCCGMTVLVKIYVLCMNRGGMWIAKTNENRDCPSILRCQWLAHASCLLLLSSWLWRLQAGPSWLDTRVGVNQCKREAITNTYTTFLEKVIGLENLVPGVHSGRQIGYAFQIFKTLLS